MNKNFLIFLWLFHLCRGELSDFCLYDRTKLELKCENFTDFNNLNFDSLNDSILIKHLYLKPKNNIDFDYAAAFQLDQITRLVHNESEITLKNFNSFDVSINEFFIWRSNSIIIDESSLNFMINNQSLGSCDLSRASMAKFFRNFKKIKIGSNVEYSEFLCPILFYRINLQELELSNVDSNIFSPINFDVGNSLQSQIASLVIKDSQLEYLDSTFLNTKIFGNLKSFSYSSNSKDVSFSIQNQVFSPFNQIQYFEISLQNFTDFVLKTNLTWLKNAGSQEFKLVLNDQSKSYAYPDKDFCIFYDSLSKKKFISTIYTNETAECSCTLVWLLKENKIKSNSNVDECLENFEQLILSCSFDEKINECNPIRTSTITTTLTNVKTESPLEKENLWSLIPALIGLVGVLIFISFFGYYVYYTRRKNFRKKYPHEKENVNSF